MSPIQYHSRYGLSQTLVEDPLELKWTSQLGGSAKDCTVMTVMSPPYCGVPDAVVDTCDVGGALDVVKVFDGVTDVGIVDDVTVADWLAVDVVVVLEQALSTRVTTNSKLNPTHTNFLFTLYSFFYI
jgi:hypothetical protein